MNDFGLSLRRRMLDHQITAIELVKETGLSRTTIQNVLHSKSPGGKAPDIILAAIERLEHDGQHNGRDTSANQMSREMCALVNEGEKALPEDIELVTVILRALNSRRESE